MYALFGAMTHSEKEEESLTFMGHTLLVRLAVSLEEYVYLLLAFFLVKGKAGKDLILGSQDHWSGNVTSECTCECSVTLNAPLKVEVKQMPKSNPTSSQTQRKGQQTLMPVLKSLVP